jgi:hypothetical protein
MNHLRAYSSPFNLGHKALKGFWKGTIYATEKIDGSQFSFGFIAGEFTCRSRRVLIDLGDPGMFKLAVDTAKDLWHQGLLQEGWSYRGEYLSKPKHNTMVYDRVPRGNIILFDVDRGDQDYVSPAALRDIAANIDLESVPLLDTYFKMPKLEDITALLETESILGGGKIEGIVFKNYELFGQDKKALMAKMVSEDFKERHDKSWKKRNPSRNDFIADLINGLATEARWMKAVQHLREQGEIEGIPQDIPIVMREIVRDVEEDLEVEVRDALYAHFWPQIRRGLTRGAAEWYKALLAEEAMSE